MRVSASARRFNAASPPCLKPNSSQWSDHECVKSESTASGRLMQVHSYTDASLFLSIGSTPHLFSLTLDPSAGWPHAPKCASSRASVWQSVPVFISHFSPVLPPSLPTCCPLSYTFLWIITHIAIAVILTNTFIYPTYFFVVVH